MGAACAHFCFTSLVIDSLLSIAGLTVFSYRMFWSRKREQASASQSYPPVSIVIPARNEEANLPRLLKSLSALKYSLFEVIVVDDQSDDRTAEVANSFGMTVIPAGEKPDGWAGKTWACHVGAARAQHEFLLFTDADTEHLPTSLQATMRLASGADLVSAVPFHLCERWWEKALLLFQLFPLIVSGFKQREKYAIGQYLLFRKSSYEKIGGHTAVRAALAEDFDFVQLIQQNGGVTQVEVSGRIFAVQMYSSFAEFIRGWKRLIRTGGARSRVQSYIELTLVFHLFCFGVFGSGRSLAAFYEFSFLPSLSFVIGLGLLFTLQKRFGNFNLLSVIFAPVSVLLFVGISLVAVADAVTRKKIAWRGREYTDSSCVKHKR